VFPINIDGVTVHGAVVGQNGYEVRRRLHVAR
jgi:hypothetical protein